MTKKLISMLLCLVMMASVIGVSATPVTEANGRITYTDNFDDKPTGQVNKNESTAYTSDVFVPASTITRGLADITANAGPDSSTAIVFNKRSDGRSFAASAALTDTSKWYEFSYDMKIVGATTSENFFLMSDGSSHRVFQLLNGNVMVANATNGRSFADSGMDITEGTWYHVKAVIHGGKAYGYIYDDAGNGVCSLQNGVEVTAFTGTSLQAFNMDATASGALTLTIDNAKLVEYVPANVAPAVVAAPAINGNQAVAIDTNTVSVTLDQPLNVAGSAVTLTADGGIAQACSIAADYTAPYKYTVTLPALESGTSYTLDLSGLKNSGNAAVGNSAVYSFKTEEAALTPDVVTSVPANGAEDVSVNTKTMTVTFNKAMNTAPETVTLSGGAADITAQVTTQDNITYTFTWEEKLAGNTTYSVNLGRFADENSGVSETVSLSFTTEYTGIIKITDDFENVIDTSGYHTYKAGTGSFADVNEVLSTGEAYMSGYVASATGYTGNALRLSTGGDNSRNCIGSLQTAASYTPDTTTVNGETIYEKFIMTYRINFEDFADFGTTVHLKNNDKEYTTKGARVQIGVAPGSLRFATSLAVIQSDEAGKAYIGVNGAVTSKKEMLEDHWYNVVFVVDGGNETMTLIDAEGENKGSVVWSASMTLPANYYTAGDAMNFYPLVSVRGADGTFMYNDSQSILLDDFTIWRIKPWSDEHALTTVGSVTEENGTFTMNFNQPVMAAKAMLNVEVDAENENVPVEFEASLLYTDFCQQSIIVKDLAASSTYTLDYSGIKALSGSGFLETAAHVKAFTTSAGTETKVSLAGTVDDSVEGALSFRLYNGAADSTKVFVAYYAAGELLGVKVPAQDVVVNAGSIADVTVSTIDGYDAFTILVWNNGLQPLMKSYSYSEIVTE